MAAATAEVLAHFGTDQWIRIFDTLSEAVTAAPVTARSKTWQPYSRAA